MSSSATREGLRIAWKSDVGVQREGNEDVVVCEAELGLFAVIDGVGGEVAGERGAAEAADVLRRRLRRPEGSVERQVREAVALANNHVLELAQDDPSLTGMSCVLTVALLRAEQLVIGHVGDTRLYLVDGKGLRKITSDHSPVGQMEEMGELSEAEAMRHPRRNEIFRDVGSTWREPEDRDFLEVYHETFSADQALLICSDGLTDQVTTQKILEVIRRSAGHPGVAVDELVRLANEAGGKDNISVIVVEGERFAEKILYADRSEDELGDTRRLRLPLDARRAIADAQKERGSRSEEITDQHVMPGKRGAGGVRGAAAVRGAAWSRWLLLGLLLLAAAVGWVGFGAPGAPEPLASAFDRWTRVAGLGPHWTLEVGSTRTYRSIGDALAAARPGDTIVVDDGAYEERIELRSGVTLRARTPRGAELRSAAQATMDEGSLVSGDQVRDARLEDFRLVASKSDESSPAVGASPLPVAVRLVDSQVTLLGLEIVGSREAAVELLGDDRSVLARSFLHDHAGACVRISPEASSELVENLLVRCGTGGAAPAVDVRAALRSRVRGNEFQGNRVAVWAGTRPLEELRLSNDFDADSEAQVVSGPALDESPALGTGSIP